MGIPLAGANFTRGAAIPIDDSMTVADTTARNLIGSGIRFLGFRTYSIADKKTYILKNGITNSDWEEDGGAIPVSNFTVDTFTANGSQTAFTLSAAPAAKSNVDVFIGGIYQEQSTFTLVGTTLTFSPAPPVTNNIEVSYGILSSTIADGSITLVKLTPTLNKGLSSSSGSFIQSTTGTYDVFSSTADVTPIGRPVRIELVPDVGSTIASINHATTGSTSYSNWWITRNGTVIWYTTLGEQSTGATVTGVTTAPSLISFEDEGAPAGTLCQYQLRVESVSSATVRVTNCKLKVREV